MLPRYVNTIRRLVLKPAFRSQGLDGGQVQLASPMLGVRPVVRVRQQVKDILLTTRQRVEDSPGLSHHSVQLATALAFEDHRILREESKNLAGAAVIGALEAVHEITGRGGEFCKDAVRGVVQGVTRAAVNDDQTIQNVVEGAILGSNHIDASVASVTRAAVEGAIRAAADVGVDRELATQKATNGALLGLMETGADLNDGAKAILGAVLSGVSLTDGSVASAARDCVAMLLTHSSRDPRQLAALSWGLVEGSFEVARGLKSSEVDIVGAVSRQVLATAYEMGEREGETAHFTIVGALRVPRTYRQQDSHDGVRELTEELAASLTRHRRNWWLRAAWQAAHKVINISGTDMAASLAFYTLLSFIPLVALIVLGFATFADTEAIRARVSDTFAYYFPGSREFLDQAVAHLFDAPITTGFIALGALILGANGLFMAANRAINRVFGGQHRPIYKTALVDVVVSLGVVLVFLISLSSTVVFRFAISFGEAIPEVVGPASDLLILFVEMLSAGLPILITGAIFVLVYIELPNVRVHWRDAAWGAVVAVLLFELSKHLFFWFMNMSSQRSVIYGQLSSVIILLAWSYLAGMVFLFGAAMTERSAVLRPRDPLAESSGGLSGHSLQATIAKLRGWTRTLR